MFRELLLLAAFAALLGPAAAQTPAANSGTTSGPASASPTTMGSGGTVGGSPHQMDSIKDQSSSVTREAEQTPVGSGASQAPRGPAVGVRGGEGAQSGPTAGETAETAKQ
jgi:hypothetical protein